MHGHVAGVTAQVAGVTAQATTRTRWIYWWFLDMAAVMSCRFASPESQEHIKAFDDDTFELSCHA